MSRATYPEAEQQVIRERPQSHGLIARKVDLAMRIYDQPCVGGVICDDEGQCRRHRLAGAVIARYFRLAGVPS